MNILVLSNGVLTPAHFQQLEAALPDHSLTFCPKSPSPEQMEAAHIIFGNPRPALLVHCRQLRLLQLISSGADAYTQVLPPGAVLANAKGAYGPAISEHLLAMLLFLMKKLGPYSQNQAQCLWQELGQVVSIQDSVALIVGTGDLGGCFARRIKALGAYTIGVRRSEAPLPDFLDEQHLSDALDVLLPRADIIALCLPNTSQTQHMLGAPQLALCKPGAFILNAGRGTAIDQQALEEALRKGQLGGAGLDVTQPEPLPADHSLWTAPHLLITPHISGGNHLPATVDRILAIGKSNILACLAGQEIANQVNTTNGY